MDRVRDHGFENDEWEGVESCVRMCLLYFVALACNDPEDWLFFGKTLHLWVHVTFSFH